MKPRLGRLLAIAEGGAGLARTVLSDDGGVVAHGAQSLLVASRSTPA